MFVHVVVVTQALSVVHSVGVGIHAVVALVGDVRFVIMAALLFEAVFWIATEHWV